MTSTIEISNTTSSHETVRGRPARQLLGLTSALLALQVLNLAVFDDLRTDESAGVLETFSKPQHLSSIVAVLLAVILVARRHRLAAGVAVAVAWIEIAAFMFFHGIPVQIGPAKPYWGDGSGDALQWLGFLSIMACSAAIVVVGRQRASTPPATATATRVAVESTRPTPPSSR
jgi:glucan phosphoethanolaminetransferase (alkaline phosphatase superfamily)